MSAELDPRDPCYDVFATLGITVRERDAAEAEVARLRTLLAEAARQHVLTLNEFARFVEQPLLEERALAALDRIASARVWLASTRYRGAAMTCRNQGAAFLERACGYCHEGECAWENHVILRRSDVAALLEEWGDLDLDPFWCPVMLATVEHP